MDPSQPDAQNKVQPMLPPGMHLDPQLPDDWSEQDIAKLAGPAKEENNEGDKPAEDSPD